MYTHSEVPQSEIALFVLMAQILQFYAMKTMEECVHQEWWKTEMISDIPSHGCLY